MYARQNEAGGPHLSYPGDGMRCPSCGTQNEPDSRFCGGCGARFTGAETKLAPTQKIHSDPAVLQAHHAQAVAQRAASVPQPSAPPALSAPQPVLRQPSGSQPAQQRPSAQQTVPGSAQQIRQRHPSAQLRASTNGHQEQRSSSAAPGSHAVPGAPRPAAPSAPVPSARGSLDQSFALPKRRWGVIIAVLVLDLGLAAAGVWLLLEGLAATRAEPRSEAAPGNAATTTGTAEPLPRAANQPTVAASVTPIATASPPASASTPAPDPATPPATDTHQGSAQARPAHKTSKPSGAPVDPYQEPPPGERKPSGPPLGPSKPPPGPPQGPPPPPPLP